MQRTTRWILSLLAIVGVGGSTVAQAQISHDHSQPGKHTLQIPSTHDLADTIIDGGTKP